MCSAVEQILKHPPRLISSSFPPESSTDTKRAATISQHKQAKIKNTLYASSQNGSFHHPMQTSLLHSTQSMLTRGI